jgi:hypothetical protein
VGLRLKTMERRSRPAARLGSITATCTRDCTLKAITASIGVNGRGSVASFKLKATITGRTIVLRASSKAVKAMRAGVREGASTSAGVIVTATAKDGVVDTASIVWSYA